MTKMPRTAGRITTFFSYKGGVGRTMAVANVGFIAAMAGKRVLLMDWDLEAPGLAVYYRGVTEHEAAGNIRKSNGVLNLFTDWRDALLTATRPEEASSIFKRFKSGAPFKDCASPLLPKTRLPAGAKLDIVGAGSSIVGTVEPLPYAEALSRFNWPSFFSDFAGGLMLEAMRAWARRNYDIILIDSRTGLADVAGICTMQLPDEVVLCFVLNRQNTEGVADIAASIRAARGNEVAIRLSPMRVSKDRPTEEADARARAHRELRNAGLESQAIERDMTRLSIGAAANIPFYETLAPFVATSATADPLTFEYLRMTQEITGAAFDVPKVDHLWIDSVRRRLQPRMTTVEYLSSLKTADPDRAFEEIARFLDGALDADPSRELHADYVEALVSAGLQASDWLWSDDREFPTEILAQKAILLLRQLHSIGEGDWRLHLVNALDEYDIRWASGNRESSLKGNAERDAILASGPQTTGTLVRRAHLHVENARLRKPSTPWGKVEDELDYAQSLLDEISGPIQPEEAEGVALGHAEIAAQRANVFTKDPKLGNPAEQWQRVIKLLEGPEGSRGRSLAAEAHVGLAQLDEDDPLASIRIVTAAQLWRPSVTRGIDRFIKLTSIILRDADAGNQSINFSIAAFARPKGLRVPIGIGMHGVAEVVEFSRLLEQLALAADLDNPLRNDALVAIAEAAEQQLNRATRIVVNSDEKQNEAQFRKIFAAYISLAEVLASAEAPESAVESLRRRVEKMRDRLFRASK
ncbi:KGGVGR-motif variant AAA ATPase [Sphingomonas sp. STIS6.2]|uniref:KGGVGR-motif variant AAA ATPase n=1 Tax=Sphingomonas sp. STIS6.2 TaxID=1379700 RepID=UPI000AB74FA0|nr:ParA family protein [Sphingomonas sp. STIS6.2]